jgi:serine protease Do
MGGAPKLVSPGQQPKPGVLVPLSSYGQLVQPSPDGPLPAGSFIMGSAVARMLDDLDRYGEVRHAYLGVVVGQMKGEGAGRGVEILSVLAGSPAAEAGLEQGSLIRSVDGATVLNPKFVTRALVQKRPGDRVRLVLVGREEEMLVTLGDRTKETSALRTPWDLGLSCSALGPELTAWLNVEAEVRGVAVGGVRKGSPAAKAGFVRGEIIVSADGEPIADLEELKAVVAGAKGKIAFWVRAANIGFSRTIELPADSPGRRKAR